MARINPRVVNKTTDWTSNARPRVGQTVRHNGFNWLNVTGKNSEPGTSNDWINNGISVEVPVTNGSHVYQLKVTDINDDPHMIVSGTYVGGDATKLESYSANSITRAL